MKKAISVLLLVCMVSALCSAGAYATEPEPYTLTFGSGDSMTLDLNPKANKSEGQISNAQGSANGSTFDGSKVANWNWSSSNTDVATIATDALVKAVKVGNAVCTLSANDGQATWTGSVKVAVKDSTFNVVSILPGSDENTLVMQATTNDGSAAEITNISWSSTDSNVVSVTPSEDGKTATITRAAATNVEQRASVIVSVTDIYGVTKKSPYEIVISPIDTSVEHINISAAPTSLTIGSSVKMTAEVLPADALDKSVVWEIISSNKDKFNITADGTISTVSGATFSENESFTVQAHHDNAAANTSVYSNSVVIPVVSATIEAKSLTINSSKGNVLTVGDTTNLTATASPSGSSVGTVTWSGSSAVADVNASTGVVTAKSAGKVTVTATANETVSGNAVTGTYEITVNPVAPTSVTVTPSEATIELSTTTTPNTKQLTATVLPDNAENKTVIWSSSNTAVATVTADTGVVTAVSKGTAVITATVKDTALTSVCTVTVTEPAAYKINLTPNTITLGQGNVNYFTATILDKNGNNVSGSDKSVTWSFTGDTSDGIGITSNGYNSTNNNYTATVLGKFNRNYVVTASCSIGGVVYSSSASVTVSFTPAIVSGQNAVYNGRDAMSFVVNDSAQNFNGHVYVDGRELSNVYYSTSNYNGYLVVTLNQSFLNFLCQYYNNNGYHTLSVDTKYGAAASYFRTWGTASSFNGVKTGDDANLGLWAALLAVSAVGAGAAVIIVKRRKTNNG